MKNLLLILFFLVTLVCFSCRQKSGIKIATTPVRAKAGAQQSDTLKKVVINEPDLNKLVKELNEYLPENDSISPFEKYDPKDFKLTKSEVDSVLLEGEDELKGKVRGSILNQYIQAHADSLLSEILNHKAIVKYNLADILNAEVTVSADKKLFSIRYDANTGGTYHSRISYMQYRPGNGSVLNFYPDVQGATDSVVFNPDGFDNIDIIVTKSGIKYLLSGNVMGCTTCIGEYIQLVHFDKGKAVIDFSYSIGRRMEDEEQSITYDDKQKRILVEHNPESDDENHTSCDCNTDNERAILMHESLDAEYRASVNVSAQLKAAKTLKCIFYFNGDSFVLNRKRSRMSE